MNEFSLIKEFFSQGFTPHPYTQLGVGDDCSIVRPPNAQDLLQSIDTQVANVHFPEHAPAHLIAQRALRCAASDLAAMGATPYGFHLALTLPNNDSQWLADFSHGLKQAANELHLELIGGDTTYGQQLVISIAVQGFAPQNSALTRSGAQVGDDLWLSGEVGRAALALKEVLTHPATTTGWAQHYYFPTVHYELGQTLRGRASACLDVSDGLLQDAEHLATAADVTFEIIGESIPCPVATDHPHWLDCLTGGDDYQLLFTMPPVYRSILQNFASARRIGQVTSKEEHFIKLLTHGQPIALHRPLGFQHF